MVDREVHFCDYYYGAFFAHSEGTKWLKNLAQDRRHKEPLGGSG